ncbi:type II secretory pathway, pseudopilin PulG [Haloferula helveola]|uniref:Type II secretory pathway, pseudopilin PulG n=1 Tax=Haloferula helveola TaxID=490095 RepID=A0ABM7RJP2_9BACT|nr:type II secretory pathway, pseudopilin PulG [Haloferula helveola]
MKTCPKRATGGFTLMEMLVVVSIIVILAGLTFGGFNFVKAKQAREQAKVQIGLLQLALEEYKADNGAYPVNAVSNGKNGTSEVYDALYPQNADDKVYLSELNPDNDGQGWLAGQTGRSLKIYDPWGTEYFYRTNNPARPNRSFAANPDFDLWSAGPDGQTSAGSNGSYDPKHPDNLDDIRGW